MYKRFNICSYILQLSYIRNLIARCCGLIFSSLYNTPKQMLVKIFYTFLCPCERKLVVCDKEYGELIEVVVKYLK